MRIATYCNMSQLSTLSACISPMDPVNTLNPCTVVVVQNHTRTVAQKEAWLQVTAEIHERQMW